MNMISFHLITAICRKSPYTGLMCINPLLPVVHKSILHKLKALEQKHYTHSLLT